MSDPAPIDLGTGCTPLVRADRLAAELGLGELWIKNDTANPTGSFKDRVVSVALTKARQLGFKVAACASTGNLANSVAAHAARAGMVSVVFIPHDLEVAKVVTTAVYGGHVVAVEGTYDDVNRLCAELASEHPSWAFVNVNVRTYYAEGSKTLAFEVAEQLGGRLPTTWSCPWPRAASSPRSPRASPSSTPSACSTRSPTSGCRAPRPRAARRWPRPSPRAPTPSGRSSPHTIAKSLAIGNPADGWYALETVRKSGGAFAAVTDDEILDGIRLLARTEGIFAETAGGVTIATLAKLAAAGRRPPRRAGRRLRHRPRPQDGRGPRRHGRAHRHHRPHPGGVRTRAVDRRRRPRRERRP